MAFDFEKNGFAVYRPQAARAISDLDWLAMTNEPAGYGQMRIALSKRTYKQLAGIDPSAKRFAVAVDGIGRVAIVPDMGGYSPKIAKTRITIPCANITEAYIKKMGCGFRRLFVEAELSPDGEAVILTPTDRKEA